MKIDEVTFCYKTKKSKKKESKTLTLDQCTNNLSSETSTEKNGEKISPTEFFSLVKMQETKKRIPKFDTDAICVKENYFRKPWYSLYGIQYATWSSSLQEYYIDYNLLWKNVVEPELVARTALLSWRTFPSQKIMTKLPKGFTSWKDVLSNGGIKDSTTNQGSLTKQQRKHFWNDQCTCPCWQPVFAIKSSSPTYKQGSCICQKTPCICNDVVVDNSWEAKKSKLNRMIQLLPWNASSIENEIKELEEKINNKVLPPKNITYKEYVLLKNESIQILKEAQEEEMQQEIIVQKCFDFFYNLEFDFIEDQNHVPKTGEELIEWFWKGKKEFILAYRLRCPENRFKLLNLHGL